MKESREELQSDFIEAERLFGRAEELINERKLNEAMPLLKKTITLNRHFSFAYITLSKILFKMHRADDAIKTLESCAATDTSFAYPYYLMAKFLLSSGKTADAQRMLEQARKIDKNSRLYERAIIALKNEKK
jgi:tetratricopeptide (TPR) repeat protein